MKAYPCGTFVVAFMPLKVHNIYVNVKTMPELPRLTINDKGQCFGCWLFMWTLDLMQLYMHGPHLSCTVFIGHSHGHSIVGGGFVGPQSVQAVRSLFHC